MWFYKVLSKFIWQNEKLISKLWLALNCVLFKMNFDNVFTCIVWISVLWFFADFFSLKYVFILSFKEINVWPMSLEDNKTNEVNILFKTL